MVKVTEMIDQNTEEQKVKYNDSELLSVFQANLSACEENRQPQDKVCDEIENLAAGRHDWSTKKAWQHKNAVPKFSINREKFAAVMQRALVQATDYFTVEPKAKSPYAQWAAGVREWLKFRLDREQFPLKFVLGTKIAATRGRMYFKPYYSTELSEVLTWPKREEPRLDAEGMPLLDEFNNPMTDIITEEPKWETVIERKLRVALVNPQNVWMDPTGRDRFKIESYKMDWGELMALAEAGHYDLTAVKQLEPGTSGDRESDEAEQRSRNNEGEFTAPQGTKEVELYEFWGDLYDTSGKLVEKNCTFTVANQTHVVRKPIKNPYWHGKAPYAWGAPVLQPFSNYDKSFLEDAIGLQKTQTEFVNLILDSALYAVAGAFSVDVEQLANVQDIQQGVYPGAVFRRKGSYSNGTPMIDSVRLNTIDPMSLSILQMVDRMGQEATGVTDIMLGVQPPRRSTVGGDAMRLGESNSLFDTFARNLEEQLIGPLMEQVWALDLQYFDWTDPCARDILGDFADELARMSDEERYDLIKHFTFRGKGLSVVLAKQMELEKTVNFMRAVGRYDWLALMMDLPNMMRNVVESLGWDPKKMVRQDADALIQQVTQMMIMKLTGQPMPGQSPPQGMAPQQMLPQGASQGAPSQLPPQMAGMIQQLMGGGQ
jgi:hypothetical protein